MKQIKETYRKTGNLHHAYGLAGDKEIVKTELYSFLENDLQFPLVGNPDFFCHEYDVFKIADSRILSDAHQSKPVKHERKVFVIIANFVTKDAQNSLLKIFEEPKAEALFFLILPTMSNLIITLKSRMILGVSESYKNIGEVEKFLKEGIGGRIDIISKFVKDIKDAKKNKSDAIIFVKEIENYIRNSQKNGTKNKNFLVIETIERALGYLNDEAPSVKVVLEHLAMVV